MSLIKVQQNQKPPMIKCPKCEDIFYIDIKPWTKDVSKVMQDNCPKCGHVIFVSLLILSHPNLQGLLEMIKKIITTLDPKDKVLKV